MGPFAMGDERTCFVDDLDRKRAVKSTDTGRSRVTSRSASSTLFLGHVRCKEPIDLGLLGDEEFSCHAEESCRREDPRCRMRGVDALISR